MSNSEGNILSFIAGVAVGALVGVLIAPDKGEKTRGRLARKSGELVDELEDRVDVVKARVDKFAETLNRKQREILNQNAAAATEEEGEA